LHKINTKKLKSGLVTSYDIHPGNGEGLFLFRHFINLSLTDSLRHLPTYLQPRESHGEATYTNQALKRFLVAVTIITAFITHLHGSA